MDDVWGDFAKNFTTYGTLKDQPYRALLQLHHKIQRGEEPVEKVVLDWCNAHGLLGILPTLAESILLPPAIGEWDSKQHYIELSQKEYLLSGGQWRSSDRREIVPGETADHAQASARERARTYPPSRLLWSPFVSPTRKTEPLRSLVTDFLNPDGLSEIPLPALNNEEFWRSYVEPVESIVQCAESFAKYTMAVSGSGTPFDVLMGEEFLNQLTSSAGPAFYETSSVYTSRLPGARPDRGVIFTPPGLLASYALMFRFDRLSPKPRRVIECLRCGSHFISNVASAAYCSPKKCRNTAKVARRRGKVSSEKREED